MPSSKTTEKTICGSASSSPSLRRDAEGAIFIEFLIVVLPFLMLLFGLAQVALMYMGGMAVKRAAATGARAAMVVLDDDPREYGGQGRNTPGGQRADAIEQAAAFPLYAIITAPKNADTLGHTFRASGDSPFDSRQNIPAGFRVDYPGGIGGTRGAPITVRVRYDFPCEVPVVRALMCPGGTVELEAQATLPNHAANYRYGQW